MEIHLIAPKDKNKWPSIWHHCFKIWENSPYVIKLWDDEEDINNLIKKNDGIEFFNIINKLPKIFKIDYVRYIILKNYGGAYFDMDVEIFIDFLPQLKKDRIYVCEGTDIGPYLTNHILISPKNHKIWDTILEWVKRDITLFSDQYLSDPNPNLVVNVVGPVCLSRFFMKYNPNFGILSHLHFSEKNDISFCRHHYTNKWHSK